MRVRKGVSHQLSKEEILASLERESSTHLNVNVPTIAWEEVARTMEGEKTNVERVLLLMKFWLEHHL